MGAIVHVADGMTGKKKSASILWEQRHVIETTVLYDLHLFLFLPLSHVSFSPFSHVSFSVSSVSVESDLVTGMISKHGRDGTAHAHGG